MSKYNAKKPCKTVHNSEQKFTILFMKFDFINIQKLDYANIQKFPVFKTSIKA